MRHSKSTVQDLVGMLGNMSVHSPSAVQDEQKEKTIINRDLEWTLKDKVKTEKERAQTIGVRLGSQGDGSTLTFLTPVRAKKKDREGYTIFRRFWHLPWSEPSSNAALGGESMVLTPVRRSARHFHESAQSLAHSDQEHRLESVLADHGYAYAPNPVCSSKSQSCVIR